MGWHKMAEQNISACGDAPGHELSDIEPGSVALFGALLAAIITAVLIVTYLLFGFFNTRITKTSPLPSPLSYSREPTPEPRLSLRPGGELSAMRAEENKILTSYDWTDRDHGIVRIPIERAMEMLADRGLPVRPEKRDKAVAGKQLPRPTGTKRR